MEFVLEDQKEFSSDKEEGQLEEDEVRNSTNHLPLSFSASSSSSGYSEQRRNNIVHQQQNNWLRTLDCSQEDKPPKLQLMADLSLKHISNEDNTNNHGDGLTRTAWFPDLPHQREHMFDKVVTPSDVGKLNRLVIPKQHAEKYFPLDSSSNEKGLLLNFEDRNGKSWRFRYSYWNSSQSYVMTKGWSRFVKEKKLDAGDIVSFERGVGELGKGHLYIDWRRRPHAVLPSPTSLLSTPLGFQTHHHHQAQYHPQSVRWGGTVLYSLPQNVTMSMPHQYYPYQHHHHHMIGSNLHEYDDYYRSSSSSSSVAASYHQIEAANHRREILPMVIDSVPAGAVVRHGKNSTAPPTTSKRLRLFGVNMEYSPKEEEEQQQEQDHDVTMASVLSSYHHRNHHHPSSASSASLQVRLQNPSSMPITNIPAEFSHKGKSSASLSSDLGL
ncbi:hypothetical protein UlMin_021842 [Ulmus minor]